MHYQINYSVWSEKASAWRETHTNRITLAKVTEYLQVIETDEDLRLISVVPA